MSFNLTLPQLPSFLKSSTGFSNDDLIVLDLGCVYMKCGYSGEPRPRAIRKYKRFEHCFIDKYDTIGYQKAVETVTLYDYDGNTLVFDRKILLSNLENVMTM
jgi:hypothetical protein